MIPIEIKNLIHIAERAGDEVMRIYQESDFHVQQKADKSLLTKADLASHAYICQALKDWYPLIPLISEESSEHYPYEERQNWEYFFLVDPLDGTKEFVKRNGEFTINIALIHRDKPIAGVIHAPALAKTYYAEQNRGAFKIQNDVHSQLDPLMNQGEQMRAIISRSHACPKTEGFLQELKQTGKEVCIVSAGSALKFGLMAEGNADIYPRFAPTMEWDTAAGHVIVNEVGLMVSCIDDGSLLSYNKPSLINPGFIVREGGA